MPLAHPAVIVVLVAVAAVALLFVPVTWLGIHNYTVKVDVTIGETCILACSYSIQSINPQVTGPVTVYSTLVAVIDPGALSIAAPCVLCQYSLSVSLAGLTSSIGEFKFVSNLVNFAYTDTVTLGFASVSAGPNGDAAHYPISVSLTLNGGQVASGTGTLCVGNGC